MKTRYDFGLARDTIFLIDGSFMLGDRYWWHGAPALSAGNVGLAVVMPVDPLYPTIGALSKKGGYSKYRFKHYSTFTPKIGSILGNFGLS